MDQLTLEIKQLLHEYALHLATRELEAQKPEGSNCSK